MPGPRRVDEGLREARRTLRADRSRQWIPKRESTRQRHRAVSEARVARLVGELRAAAWQLVSLTLTPAELSDLERDLNRGGTKLTGYIHFDTSRYFQHIQVWAEAESEPGMVDVLCEVPPRAEKDGT